MSMRFKYERYNTVDWLCAGQSMLKLDQYPFQERRSIMPTEYVGSNVVIVANHFNPSIFSQIWLVRHGLVAENEFVGGCLFGEGVAKVESNRFGLLVIPPQLQFIPRDTPSENGRLVSDKVGRIVELLPETPYTAVGLNFQWHVWPVDGDIPKFAKKLFYRQFHPLYDRFASDDANFGAYMSRNTLGCRLRLDVKPVDVEKQDSAGHETAKFHRMLLAFNYHLSVASGDAIVDALKCQLNKWDDAFSDASSLVDRLDAWESCDAK